MSRHMVCKRPERAPDPDGTYRYKAKNKDEPGVEAKVNGLAEFIKAAKFGMMTTRIADSGLLVSRCMALAAQVCP